MAHLKKAAGGQAQQFYMDIRLFAKFKTKLEKDIILSDGSKEKVQYGANIEIWADKNRHVRPYIKVPMTIFFGRGISNISCYADWLQKEGVLIKGGGGYYTLTLGDNEMKVRGDNALYKAIGENIVEIRDYIEKHGGFKLYEEDIEE